MWYHGSMTSKKSKDDPIVFHIASEPGSKFGWSRTRYTSGKLEMGCHGGKPIDMTTEEGRQKAKAIREKMAQNKMKRSSR